MAPAIVRLAAVPLVHPDTVHTDDSPISCRCYNAKVIQRTWRTLAGIRDERLIYVVMLLMVESVYVGFLAVWPALRAPALLVPFTTLISLHAALHLLAPRLAKSRAGLTGYLAAQCVL